MGLKFSTVAVTLGDSNKAVTVQFDPNQPFGDNPYYYVEQLDEILLDIRVKTIKAILAYHPDQKGFLA